MTKTETDVIAGIDTHADTHHVGLPRSPNWVSIWRLEGHRITGLTERETHTGIDELTLTSSMRELPETVPGGGSRRGRPQACAAGRDALRHDCASCLRPGTSNKPAGPQWSVALGGNATLQSA